MVDLRNFLFHSDYPMDKVVGIKQGGPITVDSYDGGSASFAHGLPEAPLCILLWSTASDFSSTRDGGEQDYRYDIPYLTASSDGTNVSINVTNNTGSAASVYWRVIMLPQPNTTADYDIPTTANPFILNTDLNYFKCIGEGSTTGASVPHTLGYRPHVLAWYQDSYGIHPLTSPILFSTNSPRVRVENDGLYFNMGSATKIFYRMYADG